MRPPLRSRTDRRLRRLIRENLLVWGDEGQGQARVKPMPSETREALLSIPAGHTRAVTHPPTRNRILGNAWHGGLAACIAAGAAARWAGTAAAPKMVVTPFGGVELLLVALAGEGLLCQVVEYHSIECDTDCHAVVKEQWGRLREAGKLHPSARLILHNDVADTSKFWHTEAGWREQLCRAGVKPAHVLLAGGSPCNNISGNNRKTRNGLQGEHSKLFFHFATAARALLAVAA